MADGPDICGMAADENDSILDAQKVSEAALELPVDRALARHEEADGRSSRPSVDSSEDESSSR